MHTYDAAAGAGESHAMIGVASATAALSWIAVSLRVYVRGIMIRSFGWDDWLMLVALVCYTSVFHGTSVRTDMAKLFFTLEGSILIAIAWTELHRELSSIPILDKLLEVRRSLHLVI